MNREALELTADTHVAHYWSRSRNACGKKGEESGHRQTVRDIRLDCDGDAVLLTVEQTGGVACHRARIYFYRRLEKGGWHVVEPVLKDPADVYGHPTRAS